MHDHRQRQGSLDQGAEPAPSAMPPDAGPPEDGGEAKGKSMLGSAAFFIVLAGAAFLLWQAFAGGGGDGC